MEKYNKILKLVIRLLKENNIYNKNKNSIISILKHRNPDNTFNMIQLSMHIMAYGTDFHKDYYKAIKNDVVNNLCEALEETMSYFYYFFLKFYSRNFINKINNELRETIKFYTDDYVYQCFTHSNSINPLYTILYKNKITPDAIDIFLNKFKTELKQLKYIE